MAEQQDITFKDLLYYVKLHHYCNTIYRHDTFILNTFYKQFFIDEFRLADVPNRIKFNDLTFIFSDMIPLKDKEGKYIFYGLSEQERDNYFKPEIPLCQVELPISLTSWKNYAKS